LHEEVARAITQSAVQAKFTPQGVDPLPLSPKDFDAMIAKEIASNHRSGQSGRAEIQLSPGFGSRQPAAMIRRP
jgi:preprotein translocase subunit SecB